MSQLFPRAMIPLFGAVLFAAGVFWLGLLLLLTLQEALERTTHRNFHPSISPPKIESAEPQN